MSRTQPRHPMVIDGRSSFHELVAWTGTPGKRPLIAPANASNSFPVTLTVDYALAMTKMLSGGPGGRLRASGPPALIAVAVPSCVGLTACGGGSSPTTPTPAPAPTPTPTPAGPTFRTVDIGPIANARESNISSPTGRRTFAGVPFEMGSAPFAALVTPPGSS